MRLSSIFFCIIYAYTMTIQIQILFLGFPDSTETSICRLLDAQFRDFALRFTTCKDRDRAHITCHLMKNRDIVNTYGQSFDGLSLANTRGRLPRSVVLNKENWNGETRIPHWSDDLAAYRTYVVSHEFTHAFGVGHLPSNPSQSHQKPCSLMFAQTKYHEKCVSSFGIDDATARELRKHLKVFRLLVHARDLSFDSRLSGGGNRKLPSCCRSTPKAQRCIRGSDKKTFALPRKFSKQDCMRKPIKGFTMRASCAPYLGCSEAKKQKKTHQSASTT